MHNLNDLHIVTNKVLPSPLEISGHYPVTAHQAEVVGQSRIVLRNIIEGKDPRLLVVVGPCSIHDIEAGREYAQRLAALAKELSDELYLVMRVYFEKPRTAIGWKGLIMDPHLDGSCDIAEGLQLARSFLREVINMGVPTATELLDPITPQYISDYICWTAIGARTTESQTHRQMASGLSMPVGFKNATNGCVQAAVNAIKAASSTQTFLGISPEGFASAVSTEGNPSCHLILRGGSDGPNYEKEHVDAAVKCIEKQGFRGVVMVDCSHANCNKDHRLQSKVMESVLAQMKSGSSRIMGVMIESNLNEGNQPFPQPKEKLEYGVSITDPCIDWDTTEALLRKAHKELKALRS
jgi:3-deoxy-7-phosphoheptulonate synthase